MLSPAWFKDLPGGKVMEDIAGIMEWYRQNAGEDILVPSYFKDPWGIHGVGHARRVLVFSLVLSSLSGLGPEETDILVQASLYHDIGRTHNGTCYVHGKKSYEKMGRLGLIRLAPGTRAEKLRFIVENHCISDQEALGSLGGYATGDAEKTLELFKIFKDSDALDRIRLGDLDTSYLRNEHAPFLVPLSREIFREIK